MLSVYRLFQIIMGLILSGFIFYLLISYAGNYAQTGDKAVKYKTIDVFIQDADNVFLTGIPLNFTGFSRDDFSSCYSRSGNPPKIFCYFDGETQESEPLTIPILLKPGEDMLISRGTLDLNWTQLSYVTATPQMTIIFNPINTDDATYGLMASIAEAFPDTERLDPKVLFNVCDGGSLLTSSHSDGGEFARAVRSIPPGSRMPYSPCTASLSSSQVLVTIDPACDPTYASSGSSSGLKVCAQPYASGTSLAFITGVSDPFLIKDPVDVAALIIGGREMGLFGKTVGEENYDSKNDVMLDHLSSAAAVMAQRSQALSHDHKEPECRTLHLSLYYNLTDVRTHSQGSHTDMAAMDSLKTSLSQASQLWSQLIELGCEPRGTG